MSAGATRHPSLDELSAWVDGEIGGTPERDALAQHVAACPSCAALVDDFRVLAGAQASAVVPQVPSGLKERVLAGLSAEARFARRRPRRFVLPLAAAATVLMGVVAVWLFRQQGDALPVLAERDEPTRQAATEQAVPAPAAPPPAEQPLQAPGVASPPGDAKQKVTATEEKQARRAQPAPDAAEQETATGFAPPPPPAPAAATRSAEQHAVAMKRADAAPVFQWKRLSPSSRDF
ncbi:MAG TPA: hypothetical protein VFX50_06935, partial [Gemmatimonadales bacterium]|nr:hypothetical protein [Gemmatimonadales bacterium]